MLVAVCWRPLRDMLRGARRRVGRLVLAGVVGALLMALVVPYMDVVVPAVGRAIGAGSLTSANQETLDEQVRSAPVLMAVMICLVGPVQEELVYRFGLFRLLLDRFPPAAAHLTAALAFAGQHTVPALVEGDWAQLVPGLGYLASGLVLSVVYARTRNLLAPMTAHIVSNLVWMLPVFF